MIYLGIMVILNDILPCFSVSLLVDQLFHIQFFKVNENALLGSTDVLTSLYEY